MLRITIAETATEQRWILEGRLVGPWVGELRTSWKKRHRAQNGRSCTVDLSNVTFIDKGGEKVLRTMSKEGTRFIATGVYIRHVLDQLKPSSKRGLLKVISCLFAVFLGAVFAPLPGHARSGSKLGTPRGALEGSTVALNSTNQRQGITAASLLLESRKEQQHGAS
jgi:hypothetical protein